MRLFYIGDVVGKPGRNAVMNLVTPLRSELSLDVVIINCENAAAGKGVNPEISNMLLTKAEVLVTGNHVWHYRNFEPYLDRESRIIRPANYPNAPGRGSTVINLPGDKKLGIIQVEGRVFMRNLECPFAAIERELKTMADIKYIFVDIHAEATSEKQAIAWYFDGQVSAIIGSHTHIPTADERILPNGTAYLTDAGMTGPYDSVIGMEIRTSIERFLTQRRTPHEVAKDNIWLCGVVIDIDDESGKARSIERVKRKFRG
ncbi:MAG: TIGR00282 family metallophosphoesterase [Deltaproteobacteria bacterium]|nr:TIGR00282 family metallophosphoesterase [Deltaproteobacteria bacterium]